MNSTIDKKIISTHIERLHEARIKIRLSLIALLNFDLKTIGGNLDQQELFLHTIQKMNDTIDEIMYAENALLIATLELTTAEVV